MPLNLFPAQGRVSGVPAISRISQKDWEVAVFTSQLYQQILLPYPFVLFQFLNASLVADLTVVNYVATVT